MSAELLRHVNGLVADFATEHGEVDLVGRRVDCEPDAYDALVKTFEAFGVVGGAGLRVHNEDGEVLLVRYEGADGWVDPGDGRHPGESYRECAKRAVSETTGIDASIYDLAQVHLLYMDDWTDRKPLPNPYVSFDGTLRGGDLREGDGVSELQWVEDVPDQLLYGELAEMDL